MIYLTALSKSQCRYRRMIRLMSTFTFFANYVKATVVYRTGFFQQSSSWLSVLHHCFRHFVYCMLAKYAHHISSELSEWPHFEKSVTEFFMWKTYTRRRCGLLRKGVTKHAWRAELVHYSCNGERQAWQCWQYSSNSTDKLSLSSVMALGTCSESHDRCFSVPVGVATKGVYNRWFFFCLTIAAQLYK
jgi:hypothetical protein